MYPFTLERPTTAAQAAQLASQGARPLAGGQTLLAAMKQRLLNPGVLADLSKITEWRGMAREGQAFRIGAMARHHEVADHAGLIASIPALAELAGGIGDMQVRAVGTLGGSLANNDPAACYPSAALALGATIHTTQRQIAADDFFTGMFSTALQEDELITAVSFPVPKRAAYVKFKQQASRFALVGVFVAQTDTGVRVAITGAGYGVFRHKAMEQALNANFSAQAAAGVNTDPGELSSDLHGSNEYRAHLIGVLTQQAVVKALA